MSMEFSRQEYWSGLPLPSPGDFPDPGVEPRSPALVGELFTTESVVKNSPSVQETQVPSLGQENPLEKEMAIHSNILA